MERHPHFDLWLHTDEELGACLGVELSTRRTLHEWPLSCVQQLDLADGRRLIYKVQTRGPTVEPEFYAEASSPLLPAHQILCCDESQVVMLIDFIDAPVLSGLSLTEAEAIRHIDGLLTQVRDIAGHPPVYVDIGTVALWRHFARTVIEGLSELMAKGVFRSVSGQHADALHAWSERKDVLEAIERRPGLSHGDAKGDNFFVLPDGYLVVDWQRPRRAPEGVDKAAALEGLGFDPLRHVEPAGVAIHRFLGLAWCVECQSRWFPEGRYDRHAAASVAAVLGVA